MSTQPNKVLNPSQVCTLLKISNRTLQQWSDDKKINSFRTTGGHRRFYMGDIIHLLHPDDHSAQVDERKKVCYCRVSTAKQKDDLDRQFNFFKEKYPTHTVYRDTGSGLNFNRRQFNVILEMIMNNEISELVITHKDRLCRFGFDMIEKMMTHNNAIITILEDEKTSPEEEMVKDLISIVTVFSSRLYGLRSHSIQNEIKKLKQ
jgi:excisionase family DNA binding protein